MKLTLPPSTDRLPLGRPGILAVPEDDLVVWGIPESYTEENDTLTVHIRHAMSAYVPGELIRGLPRHPLMADILTAYVWIANEPGSPS